LYTAFLLAATTCLGADGAWANPIFGSQPGPYYGGSYGGLWWGWDPATTAAWAPWTGPTWGAPGFFSGWTYRGGYGSCCGRDRGQTRPGEHGHHRQDGAPPDRGNAASSCDSCSFAGSGETWSEGPAWGPGGAPDLGAPTVVPSDQPSPAPAAGGDQN
jgi:hypothetical protein